MDAVLPEAQVGPDAPVTATHVRTDVFPDGGIARLHVYGSPTETGFRQLQERWDGSQR